MRRRDWLVLASWPKLDCVGPGVARSVNICLRGERRSLMLGSGESCGWLVLLLEARDCITGEDASSRPSPKMILYSVMNRTIIGNGTLRELDQIVATMHC